MLAAFAVNVIVMLMLLLSFLIFLLLLLMLFLSLLCCGSFHCKKDVRHWLVVGCIVNQDCYTLADCRLQII